MTIIINGSGTIAGLVAGGLPDATIVQADLAANVASNGPAFSAYMSTNPSWGASAVTKVPLNTKEFDTASCFNNTNATVGGIPAYSFLPNVAGYYQVNSAISFGNTTATSAGYIYIYKNGIEFKRGNSVSLNAANFTDCVGSALIYMNGSTDYIELYGVQTSVGALTQNGGANLTYFQASMVRSA